MLRVSKSVRSADLTSVDLTSKNQVSINRSSVNKDGIASAETLAVIAVAHCEVSVDKKHVPEAHRGIYVKTSVFSVDDTVNSHLLPPLTFLARSEMVTASR